jgi:alanine dehydrogenase
MIVGTVKEIKIHEYRVGLTPASVRAYVTQGHRVIVETGAGEGIGFSDVSYVESGGEIVSEAAEVFATADMVVKVKEPQAQEIAQLREDQILYTYLHLAADKEQTVGLLEKGVKAIAYETIEDARGGLPCLRPMSEIAGRLAIQQGAKYLEKSYGGRGVLLGGVPGVGRGHVGIIGGGIVGLNACKMAVGLSADVTVLDLSLDRMAYLDDIFSSQITTLHSTPDHIEEVLRQSDVLVGAVLIPGAKAPKLIKREDLAMMKPGAVIVDVAIDQGGCFETSKPTSHDKPTYVVDGIVHYCVANMPGAVARTSTLALTSVTLNYGLRIAAEGVEGFCQSDPGLAKGLNLYKGDCTYEAVAKAHDVAFTPWFEAMKVIPS